MSHRRHGEGADNAPDVKHVDQERKSMSFLFVGDTPHLVSFTHTPRSIMSMLLDSIQVDMKEDVLSPSSHGHSQCSIPNLAR